MSKVRNTVFIKFIVVATLVLFMVAQYPGVLSSAEAVKATVAVKHKPIKYFVTGHRIKVEAKVTDAQGVSLVRCYFRAAGQSDYVFVGMKAGEKDAFAGILPSPAAETKMIEYLFLTVNGKNQVVKTQVFKTERKDLKDIPDWQNVSGDGSVAVSSELTQSAAPAGFADSIAVDVVESSFRFGTVAGMYGTTLVAGNGASTADGSTASGGAVAVEATGAAAAVSAGTVTASAGLSTMAIVGTSAAVVAVGAGVAVAAVGTGEEVTGCSRYAGNWTGTLSGYSCASIEGHSSYASPYSAWRGSVTPECTFTVITEIHTNFNLTEHLQFSGTVQSDSLSLTGSQGGTMTGVFKGNAVSGEWVFHCGGGGTWTGARQ